MIAKGQMKCARGTHPRSQISRIKRCIGATLLTQKIASQESEGVIIANLINLWNAFGKPVCVKNA
jgi:hypothetical protein